MVSFYAPVEELIRRRYSCRAYERRVIDAGLRRSLSDFLEGASAQTGPFGTRARFELVAATEEDRNSLRGLGTYGFIKDPPAFVLGAVVAGPKDLEGYGYLMEAVILRATDLGLGTCWLGGSFTRSSFSRRLELAPEELMPAVASVGHPAEGSRDGKVRLRAGSHFRRSGDRLFFDGEFGRPISRDGAGPYADVLEAVRWAPSASNRQPWRIVRDRKGWHFYLERTKGYGKGTIIFTLMRIADLQRVDLGIAMCHFELSARERGLAGEWVLEQPDAGGEREYVATWRPA